MKRLSLQEFRDYCIATQPKRYLFGFDDQVFALECISMVAHYDKMLISTEMNVLHLSNGLSSLSIYHVSAVEIGKVIGGYIQECNVIAQVSENNLSNTRIKIHLTY